MQEHGRPRIYLRKIQPLKKELANENTMIWIWVGRNPFGKDWGLGSVTLVTVADAIRAYARRVRAASNHGAPLHGWVNRRSA